MVTTPLRFREGAQELLIVLLAFVISLVVRLHFQSLSRTDTPIRADAAKYTFAAFNLRYHNAYSYEPPANVRPRSRTDLRPGYPYFLSRLIRDGEVIQRFVDRVRFIQTLLGSVTVVLTYLIARQALSRPWSLGSAVLTAACPHLIALEHYILTETLFTFLLMFGVLLAVVGWRKQYSALVLVAGLSLGLSATVRLISCCVPVAVLPILLFRPDRPGFLRGPQILKVASGFLIGCGLAFGSEQLFKYEYVFNAPGARVNTRHSDVRKAPTQILRTFRPPNWYVRGERTHVRARMRVRIDEDWKFATPKSFTEIPGKYLSWNLWSRWIVLWNFEQMYNGRTHIYPMLQDGFQESAGLKLIYATMWLLHWPLLVLSVGGMMALMIAWCRHRLVGRARLLLLPTGVFLSLIGLLYFVAYIPRYTIPLRPLSYILSATSLMMLRERLCSRIGQDEQG